MLIVMAIDNGDGGGVCVAYCWVIAKKGGVWCAHTHNTTHKNETTTNTPPNKPTKTNTKNTPTHSPERLEQRLAWRRDLAVGDHQDVRLLPLGGGEALERQRERAVDVGAAGERARQEVEQAVERRRVGAELELLDLVFCLFFCVFLLRRRRTMIEVGCGVMMGL